MGSLIIKERLNLSDVETVEQIEENPYMQYFLGFERFISERPFDSSSLTHFRKRISPELISKMNEKIIEAQLFKTKEKERSLIEGKFGQLKRRFSLGRIMAKLANTTNTIAEIAFLVVNLEKILALGDFLYSFLNLIVEFMGSKKFRFRNNKLIFGIIQ